MRHLFSLQWLTDGTALACVAVDQKQRVHAGGNRSRILWIHFHRVDKHAPRMRPTLTLVLFSYVLAAFFSKPDWAAVIRSTFIPHVEWSGTYWATLVGIFGTTISP